MVSEHEYYPDLTQAAAACIKAGINMFLDRYREPLMDAIDKNMITEEDIDQVIRGTLRVMLKLGLMDNNPDNPYTEIGVADTIRPWTKPEAAALAREATARSIVLMKNEGILPINMEEIESVAVIGPSADLVVSDWYSGTPPYTVSVLDGIRNAVGSNIEILYAESNKADSAVIAASNADVAIVCIGNHPLSYGLGWGDNHVPSDGREEIDRQAISLEQEDLVKLVRATNPNTVLVLVSSFPYAISWSKEHVPAILHITQSSQELGNGLADVIFGKVSPAGRLVLTWSASIDELLPILDYNIRNGRTYMYDRHEPLFAFGHGLTYTSFEYSDLKLNKSSIRADDIIDVSLKVKNTGSMNSDEVIQLYVKFPGSEVDRPVKSLKGFKRVHVQAGESVGINISLNANELKYWNEEQHEFTLEKGNIELMVGASSEDIRLTRSIIAK
jgi:beta-glucosidase